MANQYSKLTRTNILRKVNRKRNPVNSVVGLAREFGVKTTYRRNVDWYGREGKIDNAAPRSFRERVKALIGSREYNSLRQSQFISR